MCSFPLNGVSESVAPLLIAPGERESEPRGISGDGSRIVGTGGNNAVLWERGASGYEPRVLPKPQGTTNGEALGISEDGNLIFGSAVINSQKLVSFRLKAPDFQSPEYLGEGSDNRYTFSVPQAANSDGSVIVGYLTNAANDYQAFRWSADEGILPFASLRQDPNQNHQSTATAISRNGKVITGSSDGQPVRWSDRGVESVRDLLIEAGADLSHFETLNIWAVSPSGEWLAGEARMTPSPPPGISLFVARLSLPSP
jgi:uncharacterized membrane protein